MAEALPLQPGDPRGLGGRDGRDEYETLGRLGVGEQGAVFLGRDRSGRKVAIKLLHLRLTGDHAARARFVGAFAAARRVSGFCTAAILDAGVEGDRPYVVSEWVDGPSLLQLVAEEGPRGAFVLERLAVGTAVALAAIHRAGAVHHDFKPANVLLGRTGPKVCDVAVAAALNAVDAVPNGRAADKPFYQAPEQLSGLDVGPVADVFAWGATLLYAATGRPPFGDDAPTEVMQRIMYDEPDLTALPDSLRETVADALAKDPALRPAAAALLERLLDDANPLAARVPESLRAEGRALVRRPASAASEAAPAPAHAPAPAPGVSAAAPQPAPPSAPTLAPPSVPTPPASFGQGPSRAASPAPQAPQNSSDTTRVDNPLPSWNVDVGPSESGNASEHEDMATQAVPPVRPVPSSPSPAPIDDTEATTHLIPGMGASTDDDERGSTTILSVPPEDPLSEAPSSQAAVPPKDPGRRPSAVLAKLPRLRPGNHLLGVVLSLVIGVLVGVAIIALVLLPQWRDDEGTQQAGPANASDNRPVSAVPVEFSGTWRGTAVNPGRGASFPVELTFKAGERTARAVYPRSNCAGTLTLTKGTNRELEMALAIPKPCTNGTVQITRQPDGTLQYAWRTPGDRQVGYQGRLSRG